MSAESRLLAMESELSRHRKLINYLLTNKSGGSTLKSGYMFGAAATRSLKDGRTIVVGLCLTVDDIGIEKETNNEGEITDFEFTLVDILNQGIEKSELPKNENGEVDISQFKQIFLGGTVQNGSAFIFVNLIQSSTKYLRNIPEGFFDDNTIDFDNPRTDFISTITWVGAVSTRSTSQTIQKWFYEDSNATEIASEPIGSGFKKVFDYSITYKNKKLTISIYYPGINDGFVPEFSLTGSQTIYFRDDLFYSLKVKF